MSLMDIYCVNDNEFQMIINILALESSIDIARGHDIWYYLYLLNFEY